MYAIIACPPVRASTSLAYSHYIWSMTATIYGVAIQIYSATA